MATSAQVIGASMLFAVYAVFVLYFVVKGARGTKNINDYAVGSFTFSPVYVALSLAAAMTSAATFVINPGLIATYGLSAYISYGLVFPMSKYKRYSAFSTIGACTTVIFLWFVSPT